MKIVKETTIVKPIDAVWEVLGNQFGEIDKWASIISHSELSGEAKVPGVDYSIRTTTTAQGITQQELTGFNPKDYSISYKGISGAPFFIASVQAIWSLRKKGENETDLTLDFDYETKGVLGFLLRPVVNKKFAKVGVELLEELKHYVEQGTQHPRKAASKVGK